MDSFIVTIARGGERKARVTSRRMTPDELAGMMRRSSAAHVHVTLTAPSKKEFEFVAEGSDRLIVRYDGLELGVLFVLDGKKKSPTDRASRYYSFHPAPGRPTIRHHDKFVVARAMLKARKARG